MDRIFLRGMAFSACHGVLPHERENPQRFVVDAELLIDLHEAGARVYALQQARGEGTTGRFAVVAPGWDAACERMAERIEALGWDRFTYRPA